MTKAGQILANPLLNRTLGMMVNGSLGAHHPAGRHHPADPADRRHQHRHHRRHRAADRRLHSFIARLVEGALMEVPDGLLEAAKAMGAKPLQIITKVLLPEALPGILNSVTITLVTLVNYSAMAGAIGGGGLGDVGIRYGYQRFDPTVMLVTVVILVVLVQLIQSAGERLVNK